MSTSTSILQRFAKNQSIIPDLYADDSVVNATTLADIKTLDKVTQARAAKMAEQLRNKFSIVFQEYNALRYFATELESRVEEYK
jgi:hypothetical protein